MVLCFFFKKKTAYEMRIRDWSSDVCSSDLGHELHVVRHDDDGRALGPKTVQERHELVGPSPVLPERRFVEHQHPSPGHERRAHREPSLLPARQQERVRARTSLESEAAKDLVGAFPPDRSEEHTSELQS